jgi:outer membrane immunogenic protein
MKKVLLVAPLLGMNVVSALAAAPPAKTPPLVMNSWAGFYLGAHGGYGWGNNDFLSVLIANPILTVGGINSKGALYGGHAGYNWQFGKVVAGVELDFSGTDIKGSTAASLSIPQGSLFHSRADDIKYLGTARARLGWSPADNVLLYGTAGLGWARVDRTKTDVQAGFLGGLPFSINQTFQTPSDRFGWIAGAGAEVALWSTNWVGRIEYLHYDFGTTEGTSSFVTSPASDSTVDRGGRQTIDALWTGVRSRIRQSASCRSAIFVGRILSWRPRRLWLGRRQFLHKSRDRHQRDQIRGLGRRRTGWT